MWWILKQHFGLRGAKNTTPWTWKISTFAETKLLSRKTRQRRDKVVLTASEDRFFPKCLLLEVQDVPLACSKIFWADILPSYVKVVHSTWQLLKDRRHKCGIRSKGSGIHSIDQMMKNIVKSNPVALSGKKLTNHSARKTLVKKLRTANVERQSIIQVTGHASEQSLQDNDEATEQEQQVLSSIFSNNPQ